MDAEDVVHAHALRRVGLNHHVVDLAEEVEVVHERLAEVLAERREDIAHLHAQKLGLNAVDLHMRHRHCIGERRIDAGELGTLRRRGNEVARDLGELGEAHALRVFKLQLPAARRAESCDRRRRNREHNRLRNSQEIEVHTQENRAHILGSRIALVPRLEHRDEERRVGLLRSSEEVEALDLQHIDDGGIARNDLSNLLRNRERSWQARSRRKLHGHEVIALIFVGNERARRVHQQRHNRNARSGEEPNDDIPVHAEPMHDGAIVLAQRIEEAVEEHERLESRLLLARLQEDRRKCGRKRERVDARQRDRERDGERELVVQLPGDSRHERRGNEHRQQHQAGRNDRARDLRHRLLGGFVHVGDAVLKLVVDILHHDDRIVDHKSDRQHQPKQRERVNRESEDRHEREGSDDRHRDRDHRDQRCPPVLQEDEDDDEHKYRRFDERLDEFVERCRNKERGVVGDLVRDSRRQRRPEFLELLANPLRDIEGVGIGQLVDRDQRGALAVEVRSARVKIRADLGVADILDANDGVVGADAHHDVVEFFLGGQSSLGHQAHGERGLVEARLRAKRTDRRLPILLLHRTRDIGAGNSEQRKLVRIKPDAHRVFLEAEDGHLPDALNALQRGNHADRREIRQVARVVRAVRRTKRRDQRHARRLLGDGHAELLHFLRKLRKRLLRAVLHIHGGDVEVVADLEGHRDDALARARGVRAHVQHALHAVDLLLERRGHRVGNGLRVGAVVERRHLHGGRNNRGELRDRKREHRRDARKEHHERDHRREDRPADEESAHRGSLLRFADFDRRGRSGHCLRRRCHRICCGR